MSAKIVPGTQLISRTCRLLKLFCAEKPEMALLELAELSGLPTATAYRILQALVLEGLLFHDRTTGKYRLGFGLLRFGELVKTSDNLYRVSYPWVKKLADQWGETVGVDALSPNQEIVRIMIFPSSYRISSNVEYQKPVPPHSIAAGKLMLAYLSTQEIDEYISRGLVSNTQHTITDPFTFKQELRKILDVGYATNIEEQEEGFIAVAGPVKNIMGEVVASVSMGGPITRINENSLPSIIDSIVKTCQLISADLGYSDRFT